MHQAGAVNRFQAGQELRGDFAGFLQPEWPAVAQDLGQRHPVDVFHRQQLPLAVVDEIEDAADVRRDHFPRGAHFASQQGAGAFAQAVVRRGPP